MLAYMILCGRLPFGTEQASVNVADLYSGAACLTATSYACHELSLMLLRSVQETMSRICTRRSLSRICTRQNLCVTVSNLHRLQGG